MRRDASAATPWHKLPEDVRASMAGRLSGLYGAESDEQAFDNLEADKQQSLLLFAGTLGGMGLWNEVGRVENVYGRGGVGMDFAATDRLAIKLNDRTDFTRRWAAHKNSAGGFRERRKTQAALHFLYYADGSGLRWSVHFDLYNPLASPLGAWRHLIHESLRGVTPDWQMIRAARSASGDFPGATEEKKDANV